MDTHKFFVEKMRFHLKEKDALVFVGWFFDGSMRGHSLEVYFDNEKLPLEIQTNRGSEIRQKYLSSYYEIEEEVVGIVRLPKDWRERHTLRIESTYRGERTMAYKISKTKLLRLEKEVNYYIENCHRRDDSITVSGWCQSAGEVKLELLDAAKQPISEKVEHYYRRDVLSIFPECPKDSKSGFAITAKVNAGEHGPFYLEMRSGGQMSRAKISKWDEGTKLQNLTEKTMVAARYLERNGVAATAYKIYSKLRKIEGNDYENWRKKHMVTKKDLLQQRQTKFLSPKKFSIVVPLYRTKPEYLREMIDSILTQTYPHWQLCMANADSPELIPILEKYAAKDSRICFTNLEKNEGISENTNAAMTLADGDYIVLVDHDDIVPANALYEFAAAIDNEPDIDMIYSDEDKVDMNGKKYFEPHFKSGFNIDLLCSMNYICHLLAVRRDLVEKVGNFDAGYDGAQDYDFILRCSEQAKHIHHVPEILYHWRCHMDSTAVNPASKLYAFEAGRRAIEAHYARLGIPARVENAQFYGMYRTHYEWKEEPLVSVIIPNKDHIDDLAKCVNSIYEKSDYRNFEIVIVENNSTEEATFEYYKKLLAEHENIQVLYYEGGFNYSKINNFGVKAAKGDYYLLLNNDTEMIDGAAIREMLGYCMREDVGIVGAKLLYEDDTIQHAGVVMGFGGLAGHTFIGKNRYDAGYCGRIICAQNYSAVTAACMMTKRSVFEAVGGLTEELEVAFNDIDYCMKVRKLGKLVVYTPYAELHHYESKSRGYDDSPEKVERFNREADILVSYWRDIIEGGDPYYNRNLTLDKSDFSMRK